MPAFPRPQGFVQALRLRRRALPESSALLVVEGVSDKRALFPFLARDVVVIPADGRSQVEFAYKNLEAVYRVRTLFLIDCDGGVDDSLKGNNDLIISTNRDLDADLLFELGALTRVAYEHVAPMAETPEHLSTISGEMLGESVQVATCYGAVHATAIKNLLPFRVRDAASGNRRRLKLSDVPELLLWFGAAHAPTVPEMVSALGAVLGWSTTEQGAVSTQTTAAMMGQCRRRTSTPCADCCRQAFCNGHVLVQAVSMFLAVRHGVTSVPRDLESMCRVSASHALVSEWQVAQRIRRWEAASGLAVLA